MVAIEVIYGGRLKLLNAIRLCWMDVTPSLALNMCGSLHQTISHLLRSEHGGFGI